MAKGVARVSGPIKQWGGYYASVGKERSTGFYNTTNGTDFEMGNTAFFGKLTFAPDAKSTGSVSFNRVVSDNSTPTNEPIIDAQLLHVIEPRFDRLTNFNLPGPNYHQGESRLTVNYARQLAPWARAIEVFGYRDVQHQFIEDGDFIGSPFDLEAHTLEQYPFSQDLKEDILFQELRFELATEARHHQEFARRRRVVRPFERDARDRLHLHGSGERRLPRRLSQPGDSTEERMAARRAADAHVSRRDHGTVRSVHRSSRRRDGC